MISVPFLILTMDIMTCSLDDDMLFILPAPQNITFSDNKGLLLLSNLFVCYLAILSLTHLFLFDS